MRLPEGEGDFPSREEILIHETVEQWVKQGKNLPNIAADRQGYNEAHSLSFKVEQMMCGWSKKLVLNRVREHDNVWIIRERRTKNGRNVTYEIQILNNRLLKMNLVK